MTNILHTELSPTMPEVRRRLDIVFCETCGKDTLRTAAGTCGFCDSDLSECDHRVVDGGKPRVGER